MRNEISEKFPISSLASGLNSVGPLNHVGETKSILDVAKLHSTWEA